MNADLHKTQKIRCDFDGHQPITVTWRKEGGVNIDPKRVRQEDSMLIFDEIEKADEGQYWCKGENSFSSAESYVNISVYGKIIIKLLWASGIKILTILLK